jgi:hypothetical protein
MRGRLTYSDLESAGVDAGALWSAHHDQTERNVAMAEAARDAVNLPGLKRQLNRLNKLHAEFFGEEAA